MPLVQVRDHVPCPEQDRGRHGNVVDDRVDVQEGHEAELVEEPPEDVGLYVAHDAEQEAAI